MCGISGIIHTDAHKPVSPELLQTLNNALTHRGPDDEGYFLDSNVGLGSRRLSIIDLQSGHMPVHNEDNTLWLTYNGEIYNFMELRENLMKKGHRFYTNTDTEVIVHLYEEKGEACLEDLHGMFAFALYDKKQQKLFLARDRFGEKPLYYAFTNNTFYFASELKALLKIPELKKDIDPAALSAYLFFEYVPSPLCIIQGIHKLEPASFLTFKNGSLEKKTYWKPRFSEMSSLPASRKQEQDCEEQILTLLSRSIKNQLTSDVPLGIFLSGGVDSSSLVALASQLPLSSKLKTFSIGFSEASFDESAYSKKVASLFSTEHVHETFSVKTLLDILPDVIKGMDEPFADSSFLPTYLLSKFARKHVTVALGGDGGDELFLGYPTFLAHRLHDRARFVPRPAWNLLRRMAGFLPVSFDYMSTGFKIKQFLRGAGENTVSRNQSWLSAFLPGEQTQLFRDETQPKGNIMNVVHDSLRGISLKDSIDTANYLTLRHYMADDILFKTDRASMLHSLEMRAPFLDVHFSQYTLSLPHHLKLRGNVSKYIFKKALRKYLPDDILHRSKQGFAPPVAHWLHKELKGLQEDVFSKKNIEQEGLFRHDYVRKLFNEHAQKRNNHRKPLWALLMFELWRKEHLG